MFYVYIIKSSKDKMLYTGLTNDLKKEWNCIIREKFIQLKIGNHLL